MQQDEKLIRELVDKWLSATRKGDLATVLTLLDDDVIFMVPGKEPFGKELFAANSRRMQDVRIEGTSDIKELRILGDWAWMRNYLHVTITPPGASPVTRSGYTLTILRKKSDGAWVVSRDANLLTGG